MSAPIIPGKPCDTEIGFGPRGQRDWANDVVNQWNDDGIGLHPLDREHGYFRRELMRGWVHRTLSQDQINEGIRIIHKAAWLQILPGLNLACCPSLALRLEAGKWLFPLVTPSHEP